MVDPQTKRNEKWSRWPVAIRAAFQGSSVRVAAVLWRQPSPRWAWTVRVRAMCELCAHCTLAEPCLAAITPRHPAFCPLRPAKIRFLVSLECPGPSSLGHARATSPNSPPPRGTAQAALHAVEMERSPKKPYCLEHWFAALHGDPLSMPLLGQQSHMLSQRRRKWIS